ncbi:hypothetical protein [Bartonella sp. JB15]|uniref:hypothetical protein n=1 Tax=Bartonella sp. JB15 TaxID=1933906 RepID=UPI0009C39289|nr:ATP synthase protein I [Bartonella sp. JB15]
MAKGDGPDMPKRDIEKQKHKRVSSLQSEDLERRSSNLELAFISKKVLKEEQSEVEGEEQQKKWHMLLSCRVNFWQILLWELF